MGEEIGILDCSLYGMLYTMILEPMNKAAKDMLDKS